MRFLMSVFLLTLCIAGQPLLAQSSEKFPENLTKLSEEEISKRELSLGGLPIYNLEGKLLPEKEGMDLIMNLEFMAEFFANAEGEVKAIKLRNFTEEEEEMFASFRESLKRMNELIGTEATDFEGVDMDGNTVKLSEMRGSVVAINFWFVGCKPCILEMPELNELVHNYKEKEVKFIAIALDSKASIEKFQEKRDFNYNIIPDAKSLAKQYEVSGYPTHLIVDQEGKIALFKSGYSDQTVKGLDEKIAELLGK